MHNVKAHVELVLCVNQNNKRYKLLISLYIQVKKEHILIIYVKYKSFDNNIMDYG